MILSLEQALLYMFGFCILLIIVIGGLRRIVSCLWPAISICVTIFALIMFLVWVWQICH